VNKVGIVILVIMAIAIAYREGQRDMYDKIMSAAGGKRGSWIQVVSRNSPPIYHEASICATCHGG
jgi:hypothetical protein